LNQTKKTIILNELNKILPKENIKENELLKYHTSIRVGGACYALLEPESKQQLEQVLTVLYAHKAPFYVMGNGTNLLVKDDGINAFIVKLSSKFEGITKTKNKVTALAGTSLMKLNQFAIKNGLSGLEFSYGIPGSVGGAVFMNAGAYGGQIGSVVTSVEVFYKNRMIVLTHPKLQFAYRSSVFQKNKNYIILSTTFTLEQKDKDTVLEAAKQIINKRTKNHPKEPSAGSVFRRHKTLIASKAIDEVQLKGYQIGGAKVSEKHAGFIINCGGASCEDVLKLVKHIQKKVFKKFKKRLKLEVKVLGD
jgi:UDP-N-acetylmuramate dehydrogenase